MEVGGEGVCASNLVTLNSAKQRVPVHSIGRKVEWKAWLQDVVWAQIVDLNHRIISLSL